MTTNPQSLSIPVRTAAVDAVTRIISVQWPTEQQPEQLAEALVAIGEKYDVPDEGLMEWIYFHRPAPRAWRALCEQYAARKILLDTQEIS